jgi:hypothetical protein
MVISPNLNSGNVSKRLKFLKLIDFMLQRY